MAPITGPTQVQVRTSLAHASTGEASFLLGLVAHYLFLMYKFAKNHCVIVSCIVSVQYAEYAYPVAKNKGSHSLHLDLA